MFSPSASSAPDPSAAIKRYLVKEGLEAVEALMKASESLVLGSQLGAGNAVTAKRMLNAERHVDNTAMLLRQLEKAVVQLDTDIAQMVASVTKLEDVADRLVSVNDASQALYQVMNK